MGEPRGFLIVPVGYNPSGDIRSLELDADDALQVAMSEAAKGLVGINGWVGGAWRKSPIPWGYSDRLADRLSDTDLSSGHNTLDEDTVPAGEIHVVTGLAMVYVGTVPAQIYVQIQTPSNPIFVFQQLAPASGTWYDREVQVVLKPGDYLEAVVEGATAGDSFYFDRYGYRVDIDQ